MADRSFVAEVRTRRWRFIEWATVLLVTWAWITKGRRRPFDVVVLHIAYPLGVYLRFLRWMFGVPVVLVEQWSAYHYSFNAKGRGLRRIRQIFGHGAPLVCVSRALVQDIEAFSGMTQDNVLVLDNVAETTVFHPVPGDRPVEGRFFAVASWRMPKRPLVLIGMMALLRDAGLKAELRLAGGGPMLEAMKESITSLGLEGRVTLLGRLAPEAVAVEMRRAHAFLHASDYETYSAVCAEALCCGTPVLASNVGGIKEYLPDMIGSHLVDGNEPEVWERTLRGTWASLWNADRPATAARMSARASTKVVGSRFHAFLQEVVIAQ
jgi:glycosyltransferase involved in cell wall biosynthesis